TVLRHVSASGMTGHIDLYIMRNDEPMCISYWAARATNRPINRGKHEGIVCDLRDVLEHGRQQGRGDVVGEVRDHPPGPPTVGAQQRPPLDRHGEGAGMDMGFDLVYKLSRVLFPDGFGCLGGAGSWQASPPA